MADPIAQADIQDEFAETLASDDDSGLVITDSKWSRNETELYDLLRGMGEDNNPIQERAKGSVFEWKGIVDYVISGQEDRIAYIKFRYRWRLFYPYQNDGDGGKTSLQLFSGLVDRLVMALTANRMPGAFNNNVEITSILSSDEYKVIDWVNSANPESSHFADHNIDIMVQQPC